jgi:hypothetical protein
VGCDFGTANETSQLLNGFQTSRTVTDLAIEEIASLDDDQGEGSNTLLGTPCLAVFLGNMPQLHTLTCSNMILSLDNLRAFQLTLQVNRTLVEFSLSVVNLEMKKFVLLSMLSLEIGS